MSGIDDAERAVQSLGAILSTKPHSQEPNLSAHYFEWVQKVESAHAAIRDALARSALTPEDGTRSPIAGGCVLVPSEPTTEMLNAAQDKVRAGAGISWNGRSPQMMFAQAWAAMLSAAPGRGPAA